jgi:hypothetical protein
MEVNVRKTLIYKVPGTSSWTIYIFLVDITMRMLRARIRVRFLYEFDLHAFFVSYQALLPTHHVIYIPACSDFLTAYYSGHHLYLPRSTPMR